MKRMEGKEMDYISGIDRNQCCISSLEDAIDEDNPIRFIDVYVLGLDIGKMGFEHSELQDTGRPSYAPRDLLKLYLYGYFNRVRSSRNLEKECCRNISVCSHCQKKRTTMRYFYVERMIKKSEFS